MKGFITQPRVKSEFTEITSQILGEFQLSSEGDTFVLIVYL